MSDKNLALELQAGSVVSESHSNHFRESERRITNLWRKKKRINSKKAGRGSMRQGLLSRLSTRKSHVAGISNKDGYKGRSSMIRTPSFTPKNFLSLRLGRAASMVTKSFRNNSKFLNIDDKSDTSAATMDPMTREAYDQMRLAQQPEDLEEAAEIMLTINKYPASKEIFYLGLSYLAGIATQEAEGLIEKGVLDILVDAFTHFTSAPKVLEAACVLVWNLGTEERVIKSIMDKDVDIKVADILKAHKASEGPFQNQGTKLARNPGKAGGLPPAAILVYKAVGALKVLVVNEDCKYKLFLHDENVIALMINAYTYLSGKAPRDHYAQETCIACIQNFCNGPRLDLYCSKIFDNLGHLLVIRSMLQLDDNLEIQLAGCAAIWNMCLQKDKAKRKKLRSIKVGGSSLETMPVDVDTKKTLLQVIPEDQDEEDKLISAEERRMELAKNGAGARALAALKRFKDDARVVKRAMGALKALLQTNETKILNIIRDHVHEKERRGLGIVNIFDIIMEAFEYHQESEPLVEKFGVDLLDVFEIEDKEETNREKVNELIKHTKVDNMTLTRMEKDEFAMKEVDLEDETLNKLEDQEAASAMELLLEHKSIRHEFNVASTPRQPERSAPMRSIPIDASDRKKPSILETLPRSRKTEGPSHKPSSNHLSEFEMLDDDESDSDSL